MSWRTTQLGDQLCNQDQLILDLFQNKTVNYLGNDSEFKTHLTHDPTSANVVLILNYPIWVSEIITACQTHLTNNVDTFYIGINRYCVQGNDTGRFIKGTGNHGRDLINLVSKILKNQGFTVIKSGQFDNDLGRYFNFVQPLTWVYGHKSAN
jgi:hypothetical protein